MYSLKLSEHGNPEEVCSHVEEPLPRIQANQAHVKMLYSPIDPADINICQGKYPVDLPLPATPGIEGVGTVIEASDPSGRIVPGQLVLNPGQIGHWCTERVTSCDTLVPVSDKLNHQQASMMISSLATPWLMLSTFTSLKQGDWFIQNAANSAVGRSAIQLAKAMGLHSVNIVRRTGLAAELKHAGADHVLTEEEFDPRMIKDLCQGNQPRLALNGVGGESAGALAKSLGNSGTLVTYGGMSMKPLTVGTGQLIFKDLRFRGFWITAWYRHAQLTEITSMLKQVESLVLEHSIQIPVEAAYSLTEHQQALRHAQQTSRSGKILFNCQI
jgi:trans-2-enoyl-CoA reductase